MYISTIDNLVCGYIMFEIAGLDTKILAHKLAIRQYKNYEEAQLSNSGTIFDRFDKKRGFW